MIRLVQIFLCLLLLLNGAPSFGHDAKPRTLGATADQLEAKSCPNGDSGTDFEPLPLTVQAVTLGADNPSGIFPPALHFVGGWALSSSNPNFGGLSGLSIEPDGNLLAVSDMGHFIRLERTSDALTGSAQIAPMQFENPLIRPGKLTTDAEGLGVRGGLTFVSFERDFRVMAFALETCSAAARGVFIADPPSRYGLRPIRANAGPEALWLDSEGGLHILYEQLRDGTVMTAQITDDARAHMAPLDPAPVLEEGFRPVGADQISIGSDIMATVFLYRAYDRQQGNRVRLDLKLSNQETPVILRLAPPFLTDNFEGVALEAREDRLRLWMVSDDNFSDRQQTLLYAFDLILDE